MSEGTNIEWCDFTFNPWWGCTAVSPACDHCYAEAWARRFGVTWGVGQARRPATEAYWRQPLTWNAKAAELTRRPRVFCASMADVFDNEVPHEWRARLWGLIEATPHLDWLLLTKRIGNAVNMLPVPWIVYPRPNVWLGISVVNQEEADRDIPKLGRIRAAVRFLSCEPLIAELSLEVALSEVVDWVIVGGESGPGARPMNPVWATAIRNQCRAFDVPFFFKQWGNWMPHGRDTDGFVMEHVASKKDAGRLLEGRTHDDYPEARKWV